MWITVFDKGKNRYVKCGQLINGTYYKDVKKSHIFKQDDTVGCQREILDKLVKWKIENIRCRIEGRGIYNSKTIDWMETGRRQNDWGHGIQRFLPIKDMRKDCKNDLHS